MATLKLFQDSGGNKIFIKSGKKKDTIWGVNKHGKTLKRSEFDKLYSRYSKTQTKKKKDDFMNLDIF